MCQSCPCYYVWHEAYRRQSDRGPKLQPSAGFGGMIVRLQHLLESFVFEPFYEWVTWFLSSAFSSQSTLWYRGGGKGNTRSLHGGLVHNIACTVISMRSFLPLISRLNYILPALLVCQTILLSSLLLLQLYPVLCHWRKLSLCVELMCITRSKPNVCSSISKLRMFLGLGQNYWVFASMSSYTSALLAGAETMIVQLDRW
jgi:hypothetical protein